MTAKIPPKAFVVVADGTGARFFRNAGHGTEIELVPDGDLSPRNLTGGGPSGHRPPESSSQETDEATFAKQLANELYRRAHEGDFSAIILVSGPSDPRTDPPVVAQGGS